MMKKTVWLLVVLLLVLLLSAPANAAKPEPVGERLNIFHLDDYATFPANMPFHVAHGWAYALGQTKRELCEADEPCGVNIGHYGFLLELDGVFLEPDFKWVYNYKNNPEGSHPSGWDQWIVTRWVYNFPQGMTGVHVLTGHWLATCEDAVEYWGYEGECTRKNELVDALAKSVTVEFVDP